MRGPRKGDPPSRGFFRRRRRRRGRVPVTAHLIGRWSGDVNGQGRGTVVGCEDSRPDDPNGAKDPRNLVSPSSKEF
jgi:hypothetical protein